MAKSSIPSEIRAVKELKLNRDKLIEYRQCIIPFGEHPPKN